MKVVPRFLSKKKEHPSKQIRQARVEAASPTAAETGQVWAPGTGHRTVCRKRVVEGTGGGLLHQCVALVQICTIQTQLHLGLALLVHYCDNCCEEHKYISRRHKAAIL